MLGKLFTAQQELRYLLDRHYPMKSALTFVGNHHQLLSRQSAALARMTDATEAVRRRLEKRLDAEEMACSPAYLDGFNLIITMEVALSGGMLFMSQDGVIRDLAALRGTYRLIPQTGTAIAMLREALTRLNVSEAVIFLDEPVSNSGRLKTKFFEEPWPMPLHVELVKNPDAELKKYGHVMSGDSIILDECESWFNAAYWIFETQKILPDLSRLIRLV